MKHSLLTILITATALTHFSANAKRPPKPPKEPKTPLTSEQKQAIVAGAAEVMGGILTIAQNPHNAHNVGNSIANILRALINIIVEKFNHNKINPNDTRAIKECFEELYEELDKEFTKAMTMRKL